MGIGPNYRFLLWESSVPEILRQWRESDEGYLSLPLPLPLQMPDAPGEAVDLESMNQNQIRDKQLLGFREAEGY
jgi:hypothetical protein